MFRNIFFGADFMIIISCIYNNFIFSNLKSINPSGWNKEKSLDFALKPAQKKL